jgi:hypothetical protein
MRLISLIERLLWNRSVRIVYGCALALVALWTINRAWVWESWERLPGGGVVHRSNYFDFRPSATLAFLSFPLIAYAMYKFKLKNLSYYSALEIIVGILAGGIALLVLQFDNLTHWIALIAAGYIVVRGLENLKKAKQQINEVDSR